MAAKAGADYVAPYIGRLEKAKQDPWQTLTTIIKVFDNYRFKTKILGASIHTIEQAMKWAEIGIFGITVKEDIFLRLIQDDPITVQQVQEFSQDWKLVQSSTLLQ